MAIKYVKKELNGHKKICDNEIYSNKDIPIGISKDILNFVESGFKEIKTSKKSFRSL